MLITLLNDGKSIRVIRLDYVLDSTTDSPTHSIRLLVVKHYFTSNLISPHALIVVYYVALQAP